MLLAPCLPLCFFIFSEEKLLTLRTFTWWMLRERRTSTGSASLQAEPRRLRHKTYQKKTGWSGRPVRGVAFGWLMYDKLIVVRSRVFDCRAAAKLCHCCVVFSSGFTSGRPAEVLPAPCCQRRGSLLRRAGILRNVAAQPSGCSLPLIPEFKGVTICSMTAPCVPSQRVPGMKWVRKFVSSLPRSHSLHHAARARPPSQRHPSLCLGQSVAWFLPACPVRQMIESLRQRVTVGSKHLCGRSDCGLRHGRHSE